MPVQDHDRTLVPKGRGETILVLEDDADVRGGISKLLSELGYSVRQAGDGIAVLEELAANPSIDLVLCDIMLPGKMNGLEAASAMRRTRPDLKIIFMTGYADRTVQKTGRLEDGVVPLTKPVRMVELALRLREVLDIGDGREVRREPLR